MEKTAPHVVYRENLLEFKGLDNIASIDSRYRLKKFTPTWLHVLPKDVSRTFSSLTLVLQYLTTPNHRAKSMEYYLLYDGENLIHCCVVAPKYYRFPFMGNDDIHLSFFTVSQYRGQGICPFMIRKVMEDYRLRNRYAYIVTAEENVPARRSVEKAGLRVYGYYGRPKRFWRKYVPQEVHDN